MKKKTKTTSSSSDWRLKARCLDADPEAFFPEKGGSAEAALRICDECQVSEECLDFALNDLEDLYGIWGGRSERQLRRMRRLKKSA